MTLDLSKPVQTRDGRKVIIDATDAKLTGGRSIAARVACGIAVEEEVQMAYYANGRHQAAPFESSFDIINTPERVERWVNVYPPDTSAHITNGPHFVTRADADHVAGISRIGVTRHVYENNKVVETQYIAIGGE